MLKSALGVVAVGLTLIQSVGFTHAATVNLTFDTVDPGNGTFVVNTDGSVYQNEYHPSFPGSPTPVSGVGQSSVGNGSWQAAATGGYNTITPYIRDTGSGGVNSAAFTGFNGAANIRIRDIESFSFDTLQPTGTSSADWHVIIYTAPDTAGGPDTGFSGFVGPNGDDSASWYGRRMLFEPVYSYNLNAPKDQFNSFTTDAAPQNQLGMLDKNGPASTSAGFSGGPTLQDVISAPVQWDPASEGGLWPVSGFTKGPTSSTTTVDYRDEIVNLFRLQIGSPNNHPMLLDNFSFKLKDVFDAGVDPNLVAGQTVFINFEDPNFVEILPAVPEPSSLVLLGLGGIFLQVVRRKQRAS